MNDKETDEAYQYRKDYLCKHVPEDFANRISDLSNNIEDCIAKGEFEMTDCLLHEGIEMIRCEITDDFCIAELVVFLIDSAKYYFALPNVEKAYELFGSTWDDLVKKGDPVLLNLWSLWCNHLIIQRSLYMH